jgi:hypothetical protein
VARRGSKNTRSSADEALALGLAIGKSVEQAATEAHVSRRTATRRLQDPAFRLRVSEIRKDLFDRACGIFTGGLAFAAQKLALLARDSKSEMVVLAAARSVIDYALRLREHGELEERVVRLEARAAAADGEKGEGGKRK